MMSERGVIGKYRIGGQIGQGGMGTVYLALDTRIGRSVALKMLRVDDEEMRQRFELEAQLAGRLKHPNIVTVYDFGDHDGHPFLVMEYVEGQTIASVIRSGDPMPMSRRFDVIEQVCRGLGFAHRGGIVHRDIKPSNLMIDPEGIVKILDFGIARNAQSGLTRSGSGRLVGTAAYMAPEQIRGGPVDGRCDIFSLGAVFYELLTGRRAFTGETDYAVYERILTGEPAPFEHAHEELTSAVRPVLDRALAKNPADRYHDAEAFGADLADLRVRFEEIAARCDTVIEPVVQPPATPRISPRPVVLPSTPEPRAGARREPAVFEPSAQPAPLSSSATDLESAPLKGSEPPPLVDVTRPETPAPPSTLPTLAGPRPMPGADAHRRAVVEAYADLGNGRYESAIRRASEILELAPADEDARAIVRDALSRLEAERAIRSPDRDPAPAADATGGAPGAGRGLAIEPLATRAVETPRLVRLPTAAITLSLFEGAALSFAPAERVVIRRTRPTAWESRASRGAPRRPAEDLPADKAARAAGWQILGELEGEPALFSRSFDRSGRRGAASVASVSAIVHFAAVALVAVTIITSRVAPRLPESVRLAFKWPDPTIPAPPPDIPAPRNTAKQGRVTELPPVPPPAVAAPIEEPKRIEPEGRVIDQPPPQPAQPVDIPAPPIDSRPAVAAPVELSRVEGYPGLVDSPRIRPVLIEDVVPTFPPEALKQGVKSAEVVVDVVVLTDGTVGSPKIVRGVPLFNEAALEAASRLRFRAARDLGRPVPTIERVTITFAIK